MYRYVRYPSAAEALQQPDRSTNQAMHVMCIRALKPLQLIQNEAARLQPANILTLLPLLSSLHWLPVAPCTETLTLTFKSPKGLAPPYLQSLINPYSPSRPLRTVNGYGLKL